MNEVGFPIVADATKLQGNSRISQACGIHAAQADINGLAFHVQAALGHITSLCPQHGIGFR